MRWVYILKCKDDYYYVGETTRLYRRFWEHFRGLGALNTSVYTPEKVVAVYKVNIIGKFFMYHEKVKYTIAGSDNYNNRALVKFNDPESYYEQDNLKAETNIVECMMINNKDNWEKIRGGKYTRFDVRYKFPDYDFLIKDLPVCKCGLPCDVKQNEEKKFLFFRCAKKNIWESFKNEFDTEDPCDFFMEYVLDKDFRKKSLVEARVRSERFKKLLSTSQWLNNVIKSNKCVGNCGRNDEEGYDKMKYRNKEIDLCRNCFVNYNEKLENTYNNIKQKSMFVDY